MRDIFLRTDLIVSSDSQIKRALLTGFLSVMCMLISTFYLLYNRLYKIDDAYAIYFVLFGTGVVGYMTNRYGYFTLAKILVLLVGTGVVFVFSTKAEFKTDTHFYYLVITLSGFVLFGYENRWMALAFMVITLVLFYVSFITGYSILQNSDYPEGYIRSNQIINFIIALITSGVIIYYMVVLNFQSEEALNKKQQEIVTQNEILTKTNAELDRFVYSTSHDLRAPLASMLGLIHIAKRSQDSKELHQYMDMMSSRINRLDEFIHEIIDFSRNSRTDVQREQVQLQQMINHVLDNLKHTITTQSIEFQIDVPENLYMRTDMSRLTVILNNLIGNAIKYSDAAKGNSYVRIEAAKANKGYAIIVNDNGIGIEREHQPRIFDMFYRASERSKGSGLGLYIVKESVQKLAGQIYLNSKPGLGTTFTVLLPEI